MFAKIHVSQGPATTEPASKRRVGRPRKDEDLKIQQKLLDQMQLLRHIQKTAKLSNVEIERELRASPRIGLTDGNQGKYWRRWANGEYLCAPTKLREICKIANKKGWLDEEAPVKTEDLAKFSPAEWQKIVEREARIAAAYRNAQAALATYRDTLVRTIEEGHYLVEGWTLIGEHDDDDAADVGPVHATQQRIEAAFKEIQASVEKIASWELHSTVPRKLNT